MSARLSSATTRVQSQPGLHHEALDEKRGMRIKREEALEVSSCVVCFRQASS